MAYVELPKKKRRLTQAKGEYQEVYQDKRWKVIRQRRFKENPVCMECESKGLTIPTKEIHHIIKWVEGKNSKERDILAYSLLNTISLCISCHKEAHLNYVVDEKLRLLLLKY